MKSAISDVFDHTQKFSVMLDFFQTQQNYIFINILHLERILFNQNACTRKVASQMNFK